ncbi:Uu.00g070640.m01.CDS01 [Anthostomella pinea]|uniref:Uu.00g070640.m01.CDS01 n=1 Tax=Anthostomella pinea TaxID=933095 RepID=A0AAI8VUR2_9PEZI|nr:Uu.00g070640.m01.CDS01 [Anthostomella pinea]
MADLRTVLQNTINSFVSNNTLGIATKNAALFSAFFRAQGETNADYETQKQLEFHTMQAVAQNVTRTVIDVSARRATIWTEQTITTTTANGGNGLQGGVVEVIWDFDFTEDGTRIKRIMEC